MEDICDIGEVPSLSYVVEHIYSSCDTGKNEEVFASNLVDFVTPLMSNHANGISEFKQILDPNNENPTITRSAFLEAMQKWIINIGGNDTLQNFSFRDSDSSHEKKLPFYQSTPKPSLEPTTSHNMQNILNLSNFSPTSLSSYKNTSIIGAENLVLEEKVKELEHKYGNAINELSMMKSQLTCSEEQYADLKKDLERTNRRLMLEQQIIADLQKSIEHNDDIKEDIINIKKENEHLQKMLASSKKENSNFMALIRDLEFEKEKFERRMSEVRGKDDKRKEEITELQMALSFCEEEIKVLKKCKVELEDKVEEQVSLLKHFTEMSEFMKNENLTLRSILKKAKNVDLSDLSSIRDYSNLSHGIFAHSPFLDKTLKSSSPLKNLYNPSIFQRSIFNSPSFISKLNSPVNSDGLDTPPHIRNINLSNTIEHSTCDSKVSATTNGIKNISNGVKEIEPISNENSTFNSVKDSINKEDKNSAISSNTSSSGNAVCETFEDLDMSIPSEKLSFEGENLLSELQACKPLDHYNSCFVREHSEMCEIVKEHESCPKIIDEYKQKFEMLTKNIETIEVERKNILDDYNNQIESSKCLTESLSKEKKLNEHLASENFNLTQQIVNLIEKGNEREKQLKELEVKNKEIEVKKNELEANIVQFKNKEETSRTEYSNLLNKFNSLVNEKMNIEKQVKKLKTEKKLLEYEISELKTKNDILSNEIESKDKEVQEFHKAITENKHLNEELRNSKLQQNENCHIISNLTNKLAEAKNTGNTFVQVIKKKLEDQKTKVQFLNDINKKLEERINELRNDLQHMKTEIYTVKSPAEITFNDKYESGVNIEDESTSTEGSETNISTQRPQYRKKQNYVKKTNYEKQQLKMIKLEEQVELLQRELFNEKSKSRKFSDLELEVDNLKLEKISLEKEKNIIAKQLDTIKYDLSLKENMMSEFKESQKLEFDNLSERFLKEREMMSTSLIEAMKRTEENEKLLKSHVVQLEKEINTSREEKNFLESLLTKQDNMIITLKKAISDMIKSPEEENVFEKESMLQFNRELLMKSNNSLELSENCVYSLNMLLDHCKAVLLETADELFSATKEAFEAWRNDLKIIPEDLEFISAVNGFHKMENPEFTEEKIEKIKYNMTLTTKLLRCLSQKSTIMCILCKSNAPACKGINKFTLRPPKLQFQRMPSSDPDISSSCLKEVESPEINENVGLSIEKANKNMNNLEVPNMVIRNDSITDCLGHHSNSVREALKNRKLTEKKFCHLASTWNSTLENARNKYYNLKRQCSKVRDSYLRILLQIVTYLKNHKCHQEQKSLIQALKLIEKLKDIIFDVFKLAEQFGASRQELHSMKCWHFIVEYVNGVHKENEQLRLFQYIRCDQSVEDLQSRNLLSRDVSTETDNSDELLVSSDTDKHVYKGRRNKLMSGVDRQKSHIRLLSEKCSAFSMMIFSVICFIAMFFIYIHLECIRNGNESIVCPLDFLVTIKKIQSQFHPH